MDGLSGQSCCEGRGQRAFEGQGRGNTALEPFAFSLPLICMWSGPSVMGPYTVQEQLQTIIPVHA